MAQDGDIERSSLKDLDGVRVVVDTLPAAISRYGITEESVRKSIEAKLAAAKIQVLNQGEFPVGDPFLRVRISTTQPQKDLVAYRVEVDFAQIVFMRRNPMVTFNRAQTWAAKPEMELVPTPRLLESVNKALAIQIALFVNAYLAVNTSLERP